MPQIVIASSLANGFVRFLTATGDWSADAKDAAIAEDKSAADALLSDAALAEANNIVIDPYLVEVECDNGAPVPIVYREYLRVYGPSVGLSSGKHSFLQNY